MEEERKWKRPVASDLSRLFERDRRNRWDGIGAGPNNRWLIGNGISQGRSSRYRARWFVECLASYLSEMATGGQLCKSLLRGRGRDINRSDWKRLAEFRQTSFNYLEFSVRRRESKEIGSVNYAVKTAKLFFIALVVPLPLLPLFFIVFFLLFFFFFLILLLLFFFLFVVAFFRRTGSRGEPITRSDYRPRALYARLDLRAPN